MATRSDVSKHAGVSNTTVSRVVNNNGYVSPENRKKVEEAIRSLHYTPNLIARSLKTKETKQILFLAEELSNPFYFEVYQGMEDYFRKNGYTIVVSSRFNEQIVRQRHFDGIILTNLPQKNEEDILKLGIPTVITDYSCKSFPVPSVGIDIEDGARNLMRFLQDKGHNRIAFIANSNDKSDLRYKGFEQSYVNCPLPCDELVVVADNGSFYKRGYDAALKILNKRRNVTAIFAFNDNIAIGAIAALTEKGLKVPEDISIVGFDNILQAEYTVPSLTTIHIPKYEQGYESAKILFKTIKNVKVDPIQLKTRLVIRNSVKQI